MNDFESEAISVSLTFPVQKSRLLGKISHSVVQCLCAVDHIVLVETCNGDT